MNGSFLKTNKKAVLRAAGVAAAVVCLVAAAVGVVTGKGVNGHDADDKAGTPADSAGGRVSSFNAVSVETVNLKNRADGDTRRLSATQKEDAKPDAAPEKDPPAFYGGESRANVPTLYVVDYARVLKKSRPGKIVSRYVADYKNVMDEAIGHLENSAEAARTRGNWARYVSLREHKGLLESRKTRVDDYAEKFVADLVQKALAEWRFLTPAIVLSSSAVCYSLPSQDFTGAIVERLKNVSPVMPDLPKIVVNDNSGKKTAKPANK